MRRRLVRRRGGRDVGLLGPNGSGQEHSACGVLTGFFPPTAGRAAVAGVDVADDAFEARRRVGYLPEQVPLYPELHGAALPALRRRREARRRGRCARERVAGGDRRVRARRRRASAASARCRRATASGSASRRRCSADRRCWCSTSRRSASTRRRCSRCAPLMRALGGRHRAAVDAHPGRVASVCNRVVILSPRPPGGGGHADALRARRCAARASWCCARAASADAARRAARAVAAGGVRRVADEGERRHGAAALPVRDRAEPTRSRAAERVTTALARACVAAGLPVLELGAAAPTPRGPVRDLLGAGRVRQRRRRAPRSSRCCARSCRDYFGSPLLYVVGAVFLAAHRLLLLLRPRLLRAPSASATTSSRTSGSSSSSTSAWCCC